MTWSALAIRAAPQRIRTTTPRRIHWYLPKGDLDRNMVATGQLLGEGKWQETLGFTPTWLSGPATTVAMIEPAWAQLAGDEP